MQRPFIHPYAYSITILLFTIVTPTVFILLLLLLFHYCYYYKTVATDKLLRASLFLGTAEFTTHLLRLINILWLPLCQINKFAFYFPRRLLRSPILVVHQCHSASSCFLLFFYSRFLPPKIFSELDETKAKVPIFLTQRQSPKGRRRLAGRWPHHAMARAPLAAPGYGVGPSGVHRPLPFRLYIAPDVKT
jgi:hypothetical protein